MSDVTPRRSHRVRIAAGGCVVLLATAVAVTVARAAQPGTEVIALPPSGSITVVGHGNGHGHGMSQYGARGAAIAGLSAHQIVAFYYPTTTVTTLSDPTIRVALSDAGSAPTVGAVTGLTVTGVSGSLPTSGISRYRLVAAGSGFTLQALTTTWVTEKTGLPSSAYFGTPSGVVRLYLDDGTSTDYRGAVGAARSGGGLVTIDRVSLEDYVAGVVPREMPASWQPAAVQAQAIAVRTYAANAMASSAGSLYDICDSSDCQVYGGMTHYDANGAVLWTEDQAALAGNGDQILSYNGKPAFTQFSASSGGWTVAGGEPYLPAQADTYDDAASGDPYLNWSYAVPVAGIASYFGDARVTSIDITARDGNGQWGGRVTSATVNGVTGSGSTTQQSVTGFGLQAAFGVPTNWFTVSQAPPSAPAAVSAAGRDAAALVAWQAPSSSGTSPVSGYRVSVGTHLVTAGASSSAIWVTGLSNGQTYPVSVQAFNASGIGPAASTTVRPQAAPVTVHVVSPSRLFDTRSGGTPVVAGKPLVFGVPGHGSVPVGSASTGVQLAVTITDATAWGALRVYSDGGQSATTAAIAYRPGFSATATVSIAFTPSARVDFAPSAGQVDIVVDQVSYSGPSGQSLTAIGQILAADMPSVTSTAGGRPIPVRGHAAIPAAATAVVVSVVGRTSGTSGWLRVWPDGIAEPGVSQISVNPESFGANSVLVGIGSDGDIRIRASNAALGAQLLITGYLAPSGADLESFDNAGLADTAAAGSSRTVTTSVSTVQVTGAGPIPVSGVSAVLLQVTASAATTGGWLYVFTSGQRPPGATLRIDPHGPVTSTLLVPLASNGTIALQSSGPQVSVAIDAMGYLTG